MYDGDDRLLMVMGSQFLSVGAVVVDDRVLCSRDETMCSKLTVMHPMPAPMYCLWLDSMGQTLDCRRRLVWRPLSMTMDDGALWPPSHCVQPAHVDMIRAVHSPDDRPVCVTLVDH